jgi:predicted nucleotide-binding protein (sugar kinase/HSP70/actin superfamily)
VGLVRASLGLELLPLWAHLLDQLGFEPVVSPPSNPDLLRRGVPGLPPEVCLPVKLTAGHVRYLLDEMGVDRVLLPSVLELQPAQPRDRSHSCVFAQQVPDMTAGSTGGRLINPQVPFGDDPGAAFERVSALATALDRPLADVEQALGIASERQQAFARARRTLGEEALAALPERAVVVLGKPYNLHDPFTNLNLAHHLERLGLAAIPMDCLPLDEETLDTGWYSLPWHFNREQVRAVRLTSRHRELFPVWVSSFGCGPDGFSVKHLEHALGDRPRLLMEFDEHRGEAGLVTRLEAFADEIEEHQRGNPAPEQLRPRVHRAIIERPRTTRRRVFLPGFAGHAHAFAGLLRRVGYETVILPPPDEETMRLGEEFSSGRECHPYSAIAGELVRLSRSGRVRQGDIFYTPSTRNPCLLPQYGDGYRKILDTLGDRRITVWDPNAGEIRTGLGMDAIGSLYQGLTLIDWLMIATGFYRPWERQPGAADRAFEESAVDVEETMATGGEMRDALIRGFARLEAVPLHPRDDRPIIGITGDLYSRSNPVGNSLLAYKLEAMGCVTWLSPFFGATPDFEWPQLAERFAARGELKQSLKEYGGSLLMLGVQEHLATALPAWIADRCREPPYAVLQNHARRYLSEHTNHLVRAIVAKLADFANRGAAGVISAIGINCMVGITATASIPAVRADHDDVPIVSLAYGGHEGPAQKIQLETFVHQVKQFHAAHRTDV